MAMPKKGSRSLVVGDMTFRYRIRGTSGKEVSLAVEASEDPGAVLSVKVAFRDPWLHLQEGGPSDQPLRPDAVRKVVEKALELGWDPARPGPAFKARLAQDGTLTVPG